MPLTENEIAWLRRNKAMSGASVTTLTMPPPTAGASPAPTVSPATSPIPFFHGGGGGPPPTSGGSGTTQRPAAGASPSPPTPPPPAQGALPAEPGIAFFDQDSSKLTSSDTAMLDAYAKAILAGDAQQKITVEGFASVEGLDRRNQDLSVARAKAVTDYLTAALKAAGVAARIATGPGGGPTTKFSPSDLRQNRRAVLTPAKPVGKPGDVAPGRTPQPPPHVRPPPPPPRIPGPGSDGTGSDGTGSDGTGSGSEGTGSGSDGTGIDWPNIIGWLPVGGVVVLVGVGVGFGLKYLVDAGGGIIRFLTPEEAAKVRNLPPPAPPGKPLPADFNPLLTDEQNRIVKQLVDAGHKVTTVGSGDQLVEILVDGHATDPDDLGKWRTVPPPPPLTPPQPQPPATTPPPAPRQSTMPDAPGGELKGPMEPKPKNDPAKVADLAAQEEALEKLSQKGLKIERNPNPANFPQLATQIKTGANPDALFRDAAGKPKAFGDVFAPRGSRMENIWEVINKKSGTQGPMIVVNLKNSGASAEDLIAFVKANKPVDLTDLYVIAKDGTVTHLSW